MHRYHKKIKKLKKDFEWALWFFFCQKLTRCSRAVKCDVKPRFLIHLRYIRDLFNRWLSFKTPKVSSTWIWLSWLIELNEIEIFLGHLVWLDFVAIQSKVRTAGALQRPSQPGSPHVPGNEDETLRPDLLLISPNLLGLTPLVAPLGIRGVFTRYYTRLSQHPVVQVPKGSQTSNKSGLPCPAAASMGSCLLPLKPAAPTKC